LLSQCQKEDELAFRIWKLATDENEDNLCSGSASVFWKEWCELFGAVTSAKIEKDDILGAVEVLLPGLADQEPSESSLKEQAAEFIKKLKCLQLHCTQFLPCLRGEKFVLKRFEDTKTDAVFGVEYASKAMDTICEEVNIIMKGKPLTEEAKLVLMDTECFRKIYKMVEDLQWTKKWFPEGKNPGMAAGCHLFLQRVFKREGVTPKSLVCCHTFAAAHPLYGNASPLVSGGREKRKRASPARIHGGISSVAIKDLCGFHTAEKRRGIYGEKIRGVCLYEACTENGGCVHVSGSDGFCPAKKFQESKVPFVAGISGSIYGTTGLILEYHSKLTDLNHLVFAARLVIDGHHSLAEMFLSLRFLKCFGNGSRPIIAAFFTKHGHGKHNDLVDQLIETLKTQSREPSPETNSNCSSSAQNLAGALHLLLVKDENLRQLDLWSDKGKTIAYTAFMEVLTAIVVVAENSQASRRLVVKQALREMLGDSKEVLINEFFKDPVMDVMEKAIGA
jgi:hypothetical protein